MPITQAGNGEVIYTAPDRADLTAQTGVHVDTEFALCHKTNQLKQVQFLVNPTAGGKGTLTVQCDVGADTTINLNTVASGTPTFKYIQPITGTTPTAASSSDTLTFSSGDSTVTVSGNSSTDTLDIRVAQNYLLSTGGTVTGDMGVGASPAYRLDASKNTNGEAAVRVLNSNAGSSAYAIYRIENNSGAFAGFFLNSTARSADGGAATFTIRNDGGSMRVMASGAGSTLKMHAGGAANPYLVLPAAGGCVIGSAAISTSATDGFLYVPSCAGTPTGVPTTQTGTCPTVYDSTNNKLYVYNSGWKGVTLA